jgi:hypothetical protein
MAGSKDLKLKKAWLATWEGVLHEQDKKIASILNWKRSKKAVMRYIEQVYADSQYWTAPLGLDTPVRVRQGGLSGDN